MPPNPPNHDQPVRDRVREGKHEPVEDAQEQQPVENQEPVGAQLIQRACGRQRQEPRRHVAAVERWHRHQVEHGEHDVQKDRIHQQPLEPRRAQGAASDEHQHHRNKRRQQEIAGRPGCGNHREVPTRRSQVAPLDGHGFGPAEQRKP
jgi:hypothetical protein